MDAAPEHVEGATCAGEVARIVGREGLRPEDRHRIAGIGGDDICPIDHPGTGQVEAAAVVGVVGVVAILRKGVLIDGTLPDLRSEAVEQFDIEDVDRVVADVAMDPDLVGLYPRNYDPAEYRGETG